MKILFLDIDGVLCTRRSALACGKEGAKWFDWDEVACRVIRKACWKGVRIVISSSWRLAAHKDELDIQLNRYGLMEFLLQPDWKTPDLLGKARGLEINAWLSKHREVSQYKILDDNSDMLEDQMQHLILTDGEEGMQADQMKRLLNWCGALKA